jgi:hypothetical protein
VSSTTVAFTRCGYAYTVRFAYNPDVVGLLKTTVPAFARTWDSSAKRWTVDLDYAGLLASVLRRAGHQVIGLEPPKPPPRTDSADPARWATVLLRRVGPARREPVFRALTRILHPDNQQTGDTQLQRELNAARDQIGTP